MKQRICAAVQLTVAVEVPYRIVMLLVNLNPIAPVLLGEVAGSVCSAQRFGNIGHGLAQFDYANAHTDSKGVAPVHEAEMRNCIAD